MTRMTREFSLVLLGAGMLTAAYLMWPEPDLEKKAEEKAAARVGGRSGHVHTLIWIHSGSYGSSYSSRPAALSSVSRGGFGGTAGRVGGGTSIGS
jgi:3-deoxy-D-manno-octulosonic-acid transferase